MEDRSRNAGLQLRIGFEDSGDVEQVFAALGGAALGSGGSPDFALQNVFERGDRQAQAEEFAVGCAVDEIAVARVGLDLDAQVGAGGRDVEAVRELFRLESSVASRFGPG